MDDTIYRKQAIDRMQMFIDSLDKDSPAYKSLSVAFDRCIIELKRLPSAEPERKKGRWLDSQGKEKYVGYCAECSVCGGWSEYITDFCPNCGARMDGGESE